MICVSIACGSHKRMISEHQSLADDGVRLVELRLDFLRKDPELNRLLPDRPTQVVATVRRPQDGGKWRDTEEKRQTVLRAAIAAGVDFVDLETDIAPTIPRFGKTKRIVSFHDLNDTPGNLEEIYQQALKGDPDFIKIAVTPRNISDVFRLMTFTRKKNENKPKAPMVGISMGEIGLASRILAKKFGSPFTYATFSESRVIAPGLLEYSKLRDFYRYEDINRNTEVFGVIGDPIGHSLSPLIHNAGFAQTEMNKVYLPFRLPASDVKEFVARAPEIGVRGISITIPHKVATVDELTQFDPAVEEIGACNTMIFEGKERFGYNTDYVAAILSLEIALGGTGIAEQSPLIGKKALVLGAGGAGKAVAYGLLQRNVKVTIADLDDERAQRLAEQLHCEYVDWEMRHGIPSNILVNCTPVGMHPKVNETPFEKSAMHQGMVVFDAVYNPENTLFLKNAKAKGCTTVSGVEMFIGQACMQFKLFTNTKGPASLMRKLVKNAISAIHEEED